MPAAIIWRSPDRQRSGGPAEAAASPPATHHARRDAVFTDGWGKVLRYGSCALGIIFAGSTAQLWFAAIGCAGIIIDASD